MMKRILLLSLAAVALIVGTMGCHTVRGAGEDIESTGQAIQEHTPP